MFASKINTHIWKDKKYKKMDTILKQNNFTLFELEWNNFTLYKNDTNHFTLNGFKSFANSLISFIKSKSEASISNKSTLVLSDSTIDYWNWENNKETKKANNYIKNLLKKQNTTINIDAISGSGYCAMKNQNKDFVSRLNKIVKCNKKYDLVIIIGGWNDYEYSLEEINNNIQECGKIINNLINRP